VEIQAVVAGVVALGLIQVRAALVVWEMQVRHRMEMPAVMEQHLLAALVVLVAMLRSEEGAAMAAMEAGRD
jgi:hypothetical protein